MSDDLNSLVRRVTAIERDLDTELLNKNRGSE